MKKRKLKLFSILLSLILVMVSVPMAVVAEEVDTSEVSEIVTEIHDELEDVTISDDFFEIQDDFADFNSVASTSTSEQITYLPDGIYAFESSRVPGYYMTVSGSGTTANQNIKQSPFAISPSLQYNEYALFKLTRISGTNRYSIRLILNSNLSLTLGANGTDVVTAEIPQNDSDLTQSQTFEILHNSYGYMFRSCETQKFISVNGTSEANLKFSAAVNNSICWIPHGYSTYIDDGVYAFSNNGNLGLWMDTQNNSYLSSKHAQQYAYTTCPADSFSRGGLFKVTQIGTSGRYVIRLMTNNCLTWQCGAVNGDVLSYEIPSNDSNVNILLTYRIVYDTNGFVLIPYRTTKAITATPNSTASGAGGAPDSYLTVTSAFSITDSARWSMYKYTGGIAWDVDIIAPSEMQHTGAVVGETYTVKPVVWTTSPGFQNVRISPTSSNNENAMYLKWDSDKQEALAVIANPGHISLSIDLVWESGGYISIMSSEQYEWNAIPREGTYYLQNRKTNNYASIVELYSDEGDLIWPTGSTSSNSSKWQIEHVYNSGGYVTIKSLYNGKYIGIDPNDITQIYQCSIVGNNTLWRFEILDDSSVKIICKASESSGKVAVISLSGINEGLGLLQREYTDDSEYSDEWYVYKTNNFIKVQNYYDQAQIVRFGTDAITDIRITQQLANNYFYDIFGIEIYSYSPLYYETLPDICKSSITESTLNSMCNNINHIWTKEEITVIENDKEVIHTYYCYCTNRKSYIETFSPINIAADINILWSGHRVMSYSSAGNINYNRSCSISGLDLILMLCKDADLITLIHEMAHQFGADDHYCEMVNGVCKFSDRCNTHAVGDNKRPAWCIMDNSRANDPTYIPWLDITARNINEIFCDKCYQEILMHIETNYSN